MESVIVAAAAAVLLGAFGLLAVLLLRAERQRGGEAVERQRLGQLAETLTASQSKLDGRLASLAEGTAAAQAELARTVAERLDLVTQRLGETVSQTAARTTQSLGELQTRLALIDQAQKSLMELSGQVTGLQDILSNKQARGAFGEVQLADLVRSILPPNAYAFQSTLGNGKRCDCLIRLPNPPGSIVVDAKFPLESYHALCAAGDDAARLVAGRSFASDVLKHVKDIAERYILAGETAESALMFLPSEAVYAELHARFPEVVEKSWRLRVWIVSPTTLMATLNTVRAVLKDARMREQAHVIQKQVADLIEDVQRLDRRVNNLRTHMRQADSDLSEISTSTGKIMSKAERIEAVQLEDAAAGEAPAAVESLRPASGIPAE